ncbi:integral membrane protein family I, putative [Theileria annulata]|uniref:Integral membrane protein family I, putative n=1 Tax=Theileria annulata TaxID=5874 RepID=Q4UC99_THEAN|nr:integral membrane protein family I, putative [Theileria annulata]CAI75552.1 integral membrane protein family I, putative [Theileria annulata]|eukprot:XP_955028.1 integral membrane protein family I, putative [Theileria annulata]
MNNVTSISDHSNSNEKSDKSNIKETREYKYKLYTFVIISLLQIFINYDNGVVPVMLNWIQEPYNFSSTELGLMGSLSYFAYVVMSPLMPYILLNFSTQLSMTVALNINLLSLCIYALAINKYIVYYIFFESSTVPTLTLQSVAYLPHRLKPAGASFFICQYQIFGFAFGSIIPGLAIDIFKNYTAALCVIYLPGFIALSSFIFIMYIKFYRIKTAKMSGRIIYIKVVVVM